MLRQERAISRSRVHAPSSTRERKREANAMTSRTKDRKHPRLNWKRRQPAEARARTSQLAPKRQRMRRQGAAKTFVPASSVETDRRQKEEAQVRGASVRSTFWGPSTWGWVESGTYTVTKDTRSLFCEDRHIFHIARTYICTYTLHVNQSQWPPPTSQRSSSPSRTPSSSSLPISMALLR
jgi:hypothetical protein